MEGMFSGAQAFNQPITFTTSKVTTFEGMFENAVNFAQDLTSFSTESATNMASMFKVGRQQNHFSPILSNGFASC